MDNGCGCKGIRTCLICEDKSNTFEAKIDKQPGVITFYTYCDLCERAWQSSSRRDHPHHTGHSIAFPGVTLIPEFISEEEEAWLDREINKTPWTNSQSGRRKQDYGPKANFKKKKLNLSVFTGLPDYSRELVDRMQRHPTLHDFIPIELCNLEYIPSRGSAIDPHFDDFWLWGERLVTLNLLSDTTHTMSCDAEPDVRVSIPLPRRSLVVVFGPARYTWKHGIQRADIVDKRLAVTFRELTPEFLDGGAQARLGKQLIQTALTFDGVAVGQSKTQIIDYQ